MRKVWRFLGYGLIAAAVPVQAVWLYLFLYFANTDPRSPSDGYVIPLNNHGMVAYLTRAQDDLLTWISYGGWAILAAGILVLIFLRERGFVRE